MSIKPQNEFYITAPSNVASTKVNTPADFTTELPCELELAGDWEAALIETHYFNEWPNFEACQLLMHLKTITPNATANEDFDIRWAEGLIEDTERAAKITSGIHSGFKMTIPKGYYAEVKDVLEYIRREWQRRMGAVELGYEVDSYSGRVKFTIQERGKASTEFILSIVSKSDYFGKHMGFDSSPMLLFGSDTWHSMKTSGVGARRALLNDIHSIYVYSDVIDYQIVGNTRATLMGVIPVTGKHRQQQAWQFNPLQYISVSKKSVSSIQLQLCTPQGDPIPFMSGDTLCRLHFRRKIL